MCTFCFSLAIACIILPSSLFQSRHSLYHIAFIARSPMRISPPLLRTFHSSLTSLPPVLSVARHHRLAGAPPGCSHAAGTGFMPKSTPLQTRQWAAL